MSHRFKIVAAGALLVVAVVTGSAIAQATGSSGPKRQAKVIQRVARDSARVQATARVKVAKQARSPARSTQTNRVANDPAATEQPAVTTKQPELQETEIDDDDPAEAADDDQGDDQQADDDQGDENEQADDDDQDDDQPQADDDEGDDNTPAGADDDDGNDD